MPHEAALPDPATAYQNLFQGVAGRVFLNRLAARGYPAANEKQAEYLFDIAGKIEAVEGETAVKEAGDGDPYFLASQALGDVMAQHGLDGSIKSAHAHGEVTAVKEAAAALAEDPTFYDSVLALKAAQAAEVMGYLQTQGG